MPPHLHQTPHEIPRARSRVRRRRAVRAAVRISARVFAVGRSSRSRPGQETLQLGKHDVGIRAVEPVGNYAIKLVFDDGHDTGLYTWAYLHELGEQREQKWQQYLASLERARHSVSDARRKEACSLVSDGSDTADAARIGSAQLPDHAICYSRHAQSAATLQCRARMSTNHDKPSSTTDFGYQEVPVAEKAGSRARGVRIGRRQLRPDERPHVGGRASGLETIHVVANRPAARPTRARCCRRHRRSRSRHGEASRRSGPRRAHRHQCRDARAKDAMR